MPRNNNPTNEQATQVRAARRSVEPEQRTVVHRGRVNTDGPRLSGGRHRQEPNPWLDAVRAELED